MTLRHARAISSEPCYAEPPDPHALPTAGFDRSFKAREQLAFRSKMAASLQGPARAVPPRLNNGSLPANVELLAGRAAARWRRGPPGSAAPGARQQANALRKALVAGHAAHLPSRLLHCDCPLAEQLCWSSTSLAAPCHLAHQAACAGGQTLMTHQVFLALHVKCLTKLVSCQCTTAQWRQQRLAGAFCCCGSVQSTRHHRDRRLLQCARGGRCALKGAGAVVFRLGAHCGAQSCLVSRWRLPSLVVDFLTSKSGPALATVGHDFRRA